MIGGIIGVGIAWFALNFKWVASLVKGTPSASEGGDEEDEEDKE
jgi:hypothetical protein